jgi:hypothetical protein
MEPLWWMLVGLGALFIIAATLTEVVSPTNPLGVALREIAEKAWVWLKSIALEIYARALGYRSRFQRAEHVDNLRQTAANADSFEIAAARAANGDEVAQMALVDWRVGFNDDIERLRQIPKRTRAQESQLVHMEAMMRRLGGYAPTMAPAEAAYFTGAPPAAANDAGVVANALKWWHVAAIALLCLASAFLFFRGERFKDQRDRAYVALRSAEASVKGYFKQLEAEREARIESDRRLATQVNQTADALRAERTRNERMAARERANRARERARDEEIAGGEPVDWYGRMRELAEPAGAEAELPGADPAAPGDDPAGGVPSATGGPAGQPADLRPPAGSDGEELIRVRGGAARRE